MKSLFPSTLPSMTVASTVRTSPPYSDTDTPVAAPIASSFSSTIPYSNRAGPRNGESPSGVISTSEVSPSA